MAVLKMKATLNDSLSTQMALMQMRWQQMRQFEFQPMDAPLPERAQMDRSEKIYSAA